MAIVCSDDCTTWVREADDYKDGPWIYAFTDGKIAKPDELKWKETKHSYTVDELNFMIYQTESAGKDYDLDENNCHHFAKNLYNMCQ